MLRTVLIGAGMGGLLAVAVPAAGQSIRATATVEALVEAPQADVVVKSVGGRLSVRRADPVVHAEGTRLLSRTYVSGSESGDGHPVDVRVRENGVMRLERRIVPVEGEPVGELRGSAGVLIDGAASLTITTVIAANS